MGSSSQNTSNSGSGSKTKVIVATAIAVGGLGVALLLLSQRAARPHDGVTGGQYKKFMKNGALSASAAGGDPHFATQCALNAIRGGAVRSVGGLVAFFRGPPEEVAAGQRVRNALHISAPPAVIQFLQESYLPATATAVAAAAEEGGPLASERSMMAQLVACDLCLRRLERERATAFDHDNRAHANLLQQLWVAAGKPLAAFARTDAQWEALGFQGEDPTTDIRGSGVLGLRQFVHFAQRQPQALKEMMEYNRRVQSEHGDSWYLIAVVSFQFTAQLLLQRDHPFYLAHLQVLYDTLSATGAGDGGAAVSAATAATNGTVAHSTRPVSRETRIADVAEKNHLSTREAAAKVWTDGEYRSDAEAGFFLLHEKLMLHFKACWEADKPHVMSYNTYMAEKVFSKFFVDSWKS